MPSGLSLPELKSAPVPPSLISSPFLTLPVFNCAGEAPHIITEQDNLWLQDTVPVPVPIPTSSPGQTGSLKPSNSHRHVRFLRSCPVAPSSPPIVISSSCAPRRCASSQSLNAYPLNHPSNFHFTPDHRRTLSLHPPPSSTRGPSAKGRHIRMRSDSDLAFAAKLSGETREAAVSSFR